MTVRIHESHIQPVMTPAAEPIIRPAEEADVSVIAEIVGEHARLGQLLPRSAEQIRAGLAAWLVADVDGVVVGCCCMMEMSPTLIEVRSLAVMPAYRRHGIGALLVHGLVERSCERGIPTVFALTRAVRFFEGIGFRVTDRARFPEKVWRDCVICPLRENCDETAVVLELSPLATIE